MSSLILDKSSSKKRILENFNLVIDETKLTQSLNKLKQLAIDLKVRDPLSDRLSFIEKEIVLKERELQIIYNKVSELLTD